MRLLEKFEAAGPWGPAYEAVIQLAFIAPSLPNYAIPAQAGTHSAAGVELSDGTRSQKRSNSSACGSMGPDLRRDGEKSNSQIVTMFVEAN